MVPDMNAGDFIEAAAKIIKPMLVHIAADVSLVCSIGIGFIALCFFPASVLPPPVESAKWAFALVAICAFLYLLFRRLARYYNEIHVRKRLLAHLGRDEKNILCVFIKQCKSADHYDVMNAPVAALLSKGLLYYPSAFILPLHMNVAIQPWVFRYLCKHPGVIGLKPGEVGSEKIKSWDEPTYVAVDKT
jgi:hypothetical protein